MSELLAPDYAPGALPPLGYRMRVVAAFFAVAVLLLFPYRLTLKRPWYELRMAAFSLIAFYTTYLMVAGIVRELGGTNPYRWIEIGIGCMMGFLGLCLPVSLVLGRAYWKEKQEEVTWVKVNLGPQDPLDPNAATGVSPPGLVLVPMPPESCEKQEKRMQ